MRCDKCGKEIDNNNKYCIYCRNKIVVRNTYDKTQKYMALIGGCLMAVLLFIIVGLACIYVNNKKTNSTLAYTENEDGSDETNSKEEVRELVADDKYVSKDVSVELEDGYTIMDRMDDLPMPDLDLEPVEKDGLYGLCNKNGNIVVPCIYSSIYFANQYQNNAEGIWIVSRNEKKGALDINGNVIVDTICREVEIIDKFVRTARYDSNTGWHYNLYDFNGNSVLDENSDPSMINVYTDVQRIIAEINSCFSMFDYNGNLIFDGEQAQCRGISCFRFGKAAVSTDQHYYGMFKNHYYIDINGNFLTEEYGAASEFDGLGNAMINIGAKQYNGQTYLIDKDFNIVCNLSERGISFNGGGKYYSENIHNGFVYSKDNKLISLKDFTEYDYEIIEDLHFWNNSYSEALIVKNRLNGLYGLILDGEIYIPTQYDEYYAYEEQIDGKLYFSPTEKKIEFKYGNEWQTFEITDDMLISVEDGVQYNMANRENDNSTSMVSNDTALGEKVYNIGICQIIEHNSLNEATEGFKAALTEKLGDRVKFDFQNAQGERSNADIIVNKFVSDKDDLILANATTVLQCAASATQDIPILGTSVTDYAAALDIDEWTDIIGRNISGTTDLAPIDSQEKMLVELFSNSVKVGIIYCSRETTAKYQAELFANSLKSDGIEYKEFKVTEPDYIASVVQSAVKYADVIYIPADNTITNYTDTINNITFPAGIPIITGSEADCESCGVATVSVSYYDIGYKAGEMAYNVLVNGTDITTMKVGYATNVIKKYNASVCDALGINVPAGYVSIETE